MDRLLTREEVSNILALGKSEIYKQMNQGRFPRPVRVGARAVRWRASEIFEWMESRDRPAYTYAQ